MIDLHLKVNDDIELKIPQDEDAEEVFNLVEKNRDWLGKYMDWESNTKSSEDILSFFHRHSHDSYYDDGFPLIIRYQKKIVGLISFNTGNSHTNTVEIGYWIAEEFSGKGIMTQSTKALVNFAFSCTDIETILIACEISNTKSYAIPIKLGFEFIKEEEGGCYYRDGKATKLTYQLKKTKVFIDYSNLS